MKNIIAALEKHEPELYELFAAEKTKFNTSKEQKQLKIFIRNALISPLTLR